MQTYKAFLKIALKSLPSGISYFIVFMVISILSSSQGEANEKQMYKDEEINFTVFNRDESELGESIKDFLSTKNDYVEVEDNEEAIRMSLYYRDIYYAVIIPEGFEKAIAAGEDMELLNYKVSDTSVSYYMDMAVDSYMQTLKAYIASGYSIEEATSKTSETLANSIDVELTGNINELSEEGSSPISGDITLTKPSYYYFYQYVPYIFLAIIIIGVGPILIAFNKKDLKMRINSSAQSFKSHNGQMICGVTTVGAIVVAAFNILALVLYGGAIPFATFVYYLILTICFAMVSLGITFIAGTMFSKTAAMSAFANVVSLGFSFLGGIFVPLELVGDTIKNISRFVPTYWYVKANDVIIDVEKFSDLNVGAFLKNCGIQILFAVAFFTIGLAVSRYRREEG